MKKNNKIKLLPIGLTTILFSAVCLPACRSNGQEKSPHQPVVTQIENGGFEEGDLSGWTVEYGKAFSDEGVTKENGADGVSFNKEGQSLYGVYREGELGKMRSNTFVSKGYLSFRLGGGKNTALMYVSVVEAQTGTELYRFGNTAFDGATLVKYVAEIPAAKDKQVYVTVTDNSTRDYGYFTLDAFSADYDALPQIEGSVAAQDIKPQYSLTYADEIMPNGNFADGLAGYTVAYGEDAFRPAYAGQGKFNNRPAESEVGVLRSPSFKVSGAGVISLRMGGMKNGDLTYVSVKRAGTNEELCRSFNSRRGANDEEATHVYYLDLSAHKGEICYLEFVDNAVGDWGLLILEDIVTKYDQVPAVTDEIMYDIKPQTFVSERDYRIMRTLIYPDIAELESEELKTIFRNTFYATVDGVQGLYPGVLEYNADGTTFVLTGDIPAMWLRDSSAQVVQYLPFLKTDPEVRCMVRGLILKQLSFIRTDAYANAFNRDGSVWERKFEIDSLCYPVWLAYRYLQETGDTSIFDHFFVEACDAILTTFANEQSHDDNNYDIASISSGDKNKYPNAVQKNIGLIWNGYRPSDDVCKYKYLIPSNMFASVILSQMNEILTAAGVGAETALRAKNMSEEVREAVETYGTITVNGKKIYAFEVDGLGGKDATYNGSGSPEHFNLMDDANIPSLLAAPWMGYCSTDDEIYRNTREFILSASNPYYFAGSFEGNSFAGIGSEHTAQGHVWHMALAIQMMTTNDAREIESCLNMLVKSTGGKNVMHEGFNVNNPYDYSRDWFTWPCSLFAEAVMTKLMGY